MALSQVFCDCLLTICVNFLNNPGGRIPAEYFMFHPTQEIDGPRHLPPDSRGSPPFVAMLGIPKPVTIRLCTLTVGAWHNMCTFQFPVRPAFPRGKSMHPRVRIEASVRVRQRSKVGGRVRGSEWKWFC